MWPVTAEDTECEKKTPRPRDSQGAGVQLINGTDSSDRTAIQTRLLKRYHKATLGNYLSYKSYFPFTSMPQQLSETLCKTGIAFLSWTIDSLSTIVIIKKGAEWFGNSTKLWPVM